MLSLESSFILMDAAKMGSYIDDAIELNKKYDSLYRGGSQEKLAAVAPYIFSLQNEKGLFQWYIKNGWGNAWGLLLNSSSSLQELHKHFRKFLIVQTEEGKELYFRFYDPRVLSMFLPTCDRQQIIEFFGPVNFILLEDKNDTNMAREYRHENGILKIQSLELSGVFEKNTVKM